MVLIMIIQKLYLPPNIPDVPRVLMIINRLNLGGPAFHVAILAKYLQEGFEVLLLAGTKQDSEESSDFIVKEMGLTFTRL